MAATLLAAGLIVSACKGKSKGESFGAVKRSDDRGANVKVGELAPGGSLLGKRFRFRLAIYTAEKPKLDVARELRASKEASGTVVLGEGEGEKPKDDDRTTVVISFPSIEQYAPPSEASLEYFAKGLSAEDKRALPRSRGVTALEFTGPGARALVDYRKALDIAVALARKLDGYLWDDETRDAFSKESFGERIQSWKDGLPNVRQHVTLHSYRDGELIRIVSLGMVKFGLPDVAVKDVSVSDVNSMTTLTNLVCQSLVERGRLDRPGILQASLDRLRQPVAKQDLSSALKSNAQRALDVTLAKSELQEGDADNRLLEIAFPGPVAKLQERQNQALSAIFGAEDDITDVEHDQELLAASERAKKKLFAMRARYAKGAPLGELLQVKAPFDVPTGGTEYMWVEVVSWHGDTIRGILANDPFRIPNLKVGARVDVSASAVFDYTLTKRDGTIEGNETGAIIERKAR